jgi:TPR repeat protein
MTHELEVEFGRIWKYWYGDPADRDHRKAVTMLRELAGTGYAPATYALGMAYYDGKGTRRNFQEAFDLLLKAAEAGYPDAQNMVATYYESPPHGIFERDYARSIYWYEKAARNGNSSAQINYARLLKNGWGGPSDPVEAYIWAALSVHCTPPPQINHIAENLKIELGLQLDKETLKAAEEIIAIRSRELPREDSHHLYFWQRCSQLAS